MTEIFGTTLPNIVDGAFAAAYVMMISVFNIRDILSGPTRRITWGGVTRTGSSLRGEFCSICSIPYIAQQVSINPVVVWLVYFMRRP